ncbi:MAG TPA: DbpA RNA binding domain-containing protein, partial [Anaerolineales bacterium]|nr:DbpA RNA binding domain-containing protein [Anaerolineales bacterium]
VEELAVESGCDMAEIAAAAARLARGDRPLEVVVEPLPEQAPPTEAGMVRLFVDAGRRSGVRPGDIVGAIANEAGIPGNAIGAIDIYDTFSFVDVPGEYLKQVLEGMSRATIRNREARIRLATAQERETQAALGRSKFKGKKIYPKSGKKFHRR